MPAKSKAQQMAAGAALSAKRGDKKAGALKGALQRSRGLTFVLISHNVSVVRHMADRVAVMYLGQIVELGSAEQVLERPRHPYTQLLLDAVPRLGAPLADSQVSAPTELPGNRKLPSGCFFFDRCSRRGPGCEQPQPLLGDATQQVRCHRHDRTG